MQPMLPDAAERSIILALPLEIWQLIMLNSPQVYRIMIRICKHFRVNHMVAKDALTCPNTQSGHTGYTLPNGIFHRGYDQPALIGPDGYQFWYLDGELHRDGGPAVIHGSGIKEWYSHGTFVRSYHDFKIHR